MGADFLLQEPFMIISCLFSLAVYCLFYGKLPSPLLFSGAVLLLAVSLLFRHKHGHKHGGFLSIDVQVQKSRLKSWHPGIKTCFAVASALICIAADSITLSLFVIASMMLFTIYGGKTPAHYYFALLTAPLTFIILGVVAILFEISPAPLGILNIAIGGSYLSVTYGSQQAALSLICRAFGAVSCLYLLSLSTPMHQIIGFLRKIKTPALIVELMYLIYRYIFLLLATQQQMATAAEARLGYRDWRISLRTMASSSLNLLFLSFRRSSDCFTAMEARCYDGEIAFLERKNGLRKTEVLAAAAYLLLLLGFWYGTRRLQG